jgi:flavin reductase (DIM6/NTAB) family NADH-FMN oxidoreductase RutF
MKDMNRRHFLTKSLHGAAGLSLGAAGLGTASAGDESAGTKETKAKGSQKQVDYREAIRTKYPEQLIITIAKDEKGKPNPMTMGWTMITSGNPPMMAVSLSKGHYTTKCIKQSKCFTIVYPSSEMADAALFFGTHTGWNTDKFAEFDCPHEPAKEIDSVLLTEAVANFECQLEKEVETGDHIIFVGRIVASHINTEPKKRLYIIGSGSKLGAVEPVKQS